MACPFCYIPFGSKDADFGLCKEIISIISSHFQIITFGGGDPLKYHFFPDLVEEAIKKEFFVHIDTNAIGLRAKRNQAEDFSRERILFGVPLDGASAQTHNGVRAASFNHFDIVIDEIRWLIDLGFKVKINTIVVRENISELPRIHNLLESLKVPYWSIYQFMDLSQKKETNYFSVDDEVFLNYAKKIENIPSKIEIEINDRNSRLSNYPFIDQNGIIYIHNPTSSQEYLFLGSVFDKSVFEKLTSIVFLEREKSKTRYSDKF